jgi:hypothetical protein
MNKNCSTEVEDNNHFLLAKRKKLCNNTSSSGIRTEGTRSTAPEKIKRPKLSKDTGTKLSRTTQVNSSPNISSQIYATWNSEEEKHQTPRTNSRDEEDEEEAAENKKMLIFLEDSLTSPSVAGKSIMDFYDGPFVRKTSCVLWPLI